MAWEMIDAVNGLGGAPRPILDNGNGNFYVPRTNVYATDLYVSGSQQGPWPVAASIANFQPDKSYIDGSYIHMLSPQSAGYMMYSRYNIAMAYFDIEKEYISTNYDNKVTSMVYFGDPTSYTLWFAYENNKSAKRIFLGRRNTGGSYTIGIAAQTGVPRNVPEYPIGLGRGAGSLVHLFYKFNTYYDPALRCVSYNTATGIWGTPFIVHSNSFVNNTYYNDMFDTGTMPVLSYTDNLGNVHNCLVDCAGGYWSGSSMTNSGIIRFIDVISAQNPTTYSATVVFGPGYCSFANCGFDTEANLPYVVYSSGPDNVFDNLRIRFTYPPFTVKEQVHPTYSGVSWITSIFGTPWMLVGGKTYRRISSTGSPWGPVVAMF